MKQPSPRFGHQRRQTTIIRRLLGLHPEAQVVAGPVDVLIDELSVFVPDIVVLDSAPPDDAQYVGAPLVVFEILSPSTRDRDRGFKTRRLLGLGVKEVWLIDGAKRRIEVATVDGGLTAHDAETAESQVIDGFALTPRGLFAR